MRVLLDECVDSRLAYLIVGHAVTTVPQAGWSGISNGDLLGKASGAFDVFVTVDRNLSFQQNVARHDIAVIVLRARSNRLTDLRGLMPGLFSALAVAVRGEVLWIDE